MFTLLTLCVSCTPICFSKIHEIIKFKNLKGTKKKDMRNFGVYKKITALRPASYAPTHLN